MEKPKVLLIDDRRWFHWLWTLGIKHNFHFLRAYTLHQAHELFSANPDVAAIVVDGNVHSWWLDTCEIIREMKETFSGPIIAAPINVFYWRSMRNAGCTHHVLKYEVTGLLRFLLLVKPRLKKIKRVPTAAR